MAAEEMFMAIDSLWFFPKNPSPGITLPTSQISFNAQDETSSQDSDGEKPRCHSSSPSMSSDRRLKRRRSRKSCGDAELEEVKGFMDLGFDFKREENPSDHLVRLIPGLRRIGCSPLMDLRGERDSVVKSHLKRWARTVALVVQQEY